MSLPLPRTLPVLAVLLLAVACDGDDPSGTGPSGDPIEAPDEADPAPDPADDGQADDAPDPAPGPDDEQAGDDDLGTVPDEIDAGHVETVLARYTDAFTPALQDSIDQGRMTDRFGDATAAWWTAEWTARIQQIHLSWIEERPGELRDPLEPRYHQVDELVAVTDDCVVARTTVDNTAWNRADDAATLEHVTVLTTVGDGPDDEHNPSPWRIDFDAQPTGDGEVGAGMCPHG